MSSPSQRKVFNIDVFPLCLVVTLVTTEVKSSFEDCLQISLFAFQGMLVYMDWHSHLHTFVYICIDLHAFRLCLDASYLFGSVLEQAAVCAYAYVVYAYCASPPSSALELQ